MKTIKIGDIILIILIIVLTVFLGFLNSKKGERAIVEVNGNVIKTFDLSVDSQFVYEGKYKNTITVKNGEIFVFESDCPDKSCVHSGTIKTSAKVICCLPNELIIRVLSANEKVDVISG